MQFSSDKLRQRYEGWEYGPIKRKMRLVFQFVKSFCFCPSDPLLCLCSWHRIWPELDHSKLLGGFNATKWTAGLRALLKELADPNALDFHGHDIRRGAAIDIFSERGVAAMLQHCNWRSLGCRLTKFRQASSHKALRMSQSLIHNTSFSPHIGMGFF